MRRAAAGRQSSKDTVIVTPGEGSTVLVPVIDCTGMTMVHCHILEHEEIGMTGMWPIMDGGMQPM